MNMVCDVCGKPCEVIATREKDDAYTPAHFFCQEHYDDWVNNEIEIPAERLEVLE